LVGPGFQSFVAWRYLLARPQRVSRPVVAVILACLVASLVSRAIALALVDWYRDHQPATRPFNELVASLSPLHAYDQIGMWIMRGVGAALILGGALLTRARGSWVVAIAWALVVAGILLFGWGIACHWLVGKLTFVERALQGHLYVLGPLALLVPLLVFRYFFSFFTTVSMTGVFIGSMALVVVLSIMSGFEHDLRDKILGSNAHIRVTRQDGMIEEWQELMVRLRRVPGVVAVTPYATSEVVLATSSSHQPVLIKGIDPETIAEASRLVDDIIGTPEEDQAAMRRLYPLRRDPVLDRPAAADPDPGPPGSGFDPAPDDMVDLDEPADYSGGAAPGAGGAGPSPPGEPDPAEDSDLDDAAADDDDDDGPDDFGAGAARGDLDDDGPEDFSAGAALGRRLGGADREPAIFDLPPPGGRGRVELLDGVLVGKELAKQLHLYVGQEVRLVSPFADPANPDATGTPIPFHRDYRVAGIFYTGMYEYDHKFVYVTLDSLQGFLQLGDAIEGIEVRIGDADATERVRASLARALGPDYRVQDWKELNRNLFSALKLEKIAMFLVLAIVILVASFSIIGNLIMVVVEKGKEIALLKTLGASDLGVMRVFVMQGFFIGLVGTVTGVSLGLLTCWGAQRQGIPINPDVYYIEELPIHIDPVSVGLVAAAGLVISAVATIYPATIAARMRPALGLRHD
jgi:lipoprotein-releasing system permease protein